jgi:hypothetical protein
MMTASRSPKRPDARSDPQDTDRNTTWTRGLFEAMRPFFADGAYVNYLGGDEGDEGLRAAYGAEKIARLAALKGSTTLATCSG